MHSLLLAMLSLLLLILNLLFYSHLSSPSFLLLLLLLFVLKFCFPSSNTARLPTKNEFILFAYLHLRALLTFLLHYLIVKSFLCSFVKDSLSHNHLFTIEFSDKVLLRFAHAVKLTLFFFQIILHCSIYFVYLSVYFFVISHSSFRLSCSPPPCFSFFFFFTF